MDKWADLREYAANKHPASDVAMTAGEASELLAERDALAIEVLALRTALRLHCIRDSFDTHAKRCTNCGSAWDGDVERHEPNCLAEQIEKDKTNASA